MPQPFVHAQDAGIATMTAVAPATDVGDSYGNGGIHVSGTSARGAVDYRSDIFSFGAVLYEMVCGKRAFKRDTAADTMAAILNDDPPELLESDPPDSSSTRPYCAPLLEKAPEQRFQSARDLAFDLESITSLSVSGSLSAAKVKERRRWLYAAGFAGLLAIAMVGAWKISAVLRAVTGSRFHQVTYRRGMLGSHGLRLTDKTSSIRQHGKVQNPNSILWPPIRSADTHSASGMHDCWRSPGTAKLRSRCSHGIGVFPCTRYVGADHGRQQRTQAGNRKYSSGKLHAGRLGARHCALRAGGSNVPTGIPDRKGAWAGKLVDNLRFSPDGRYCLHHTRQPRR